MPKGRPKGLRKSGGRVKGVPNKATREIRELVQNYVDWEGLIEALEIRAKKKSDLAARLLFEYGFGKAKEMGDGSSGLNDSEIVSALKGIASAFVAHPGQGVVTPRDIEMPPEPSAV